MRNCSFLNSLHVSFLPFFWFLILICISWRNFIKILRRLIYILWKRWHNDLMMQFLHYEAYGHSCNERVYVLAWSTLFDDENNLMSCLSLKKSTDIRYHFWTFSSQDVSSTCKLCKIEKKYDICWISEAVIIEFIVYHTLHCYKVGRWWNVRFV